MGPRVLSLAECLERDRPEVWLEMKETSGAVPVRFHAERRPFLRFNAQDRVLAFDLRGDEYGISWRCWSMWPEETDWTPGRAIGCSERDEAREKRFAEILDSVDAGKKAGVEAKKPQRPVMRPANPKKKPTGQ